MLKPLFVYGIAAGTLEKNARSKQALNQ